MFGLKQRDMDYFHQAFRQLPEIEQVVIFGSRAKGNSKSGSDIDLALKGSSVTDDTVMRLRTLLEELPLPYFFDILDYAAIQNKDIRDHIDRVGEVLYQKADH
jgi:predicted nucleotidyltransferase